MQPETAPQQYNSMPMVPSVSPKGGLNWKKVLIFALVAIIAAALSGVSVWAYLSNQNDNNTKSLNVQITTKNNKIASLQSTVKSLDTQVAAKTTTTKTTTPATATTVVNVIDSLKTSCTSTQNTLSNYFYASVTAGIYGGCNVNNTYRIVKYTNGSWSVLVEGQQISKADLIKYGVPSNVVVTPDNYGTMP